LVLHVTHLIHGQWKWTPPDLVRLALCRFSLSALLSTKKEKEVGTSSYREVQHARLPLAFTIYFHAQVARKTRQTISKFEVRVPRILTSACRRLALAQDLEHEPARNRAECWSSIWSDSQLHVFVPNLNYSFAIPYFEHDESRQEIMTVL